MKKHCIVLLLLSCLLVPVFAAGGKESATPVATHAVETDLSYDELVAAAQKEGTLTIYSPSSRHNSIGEAFGKKYGIKVVTTQLKDTEMVEKVSKEAAAKLDAADVVFVQDGGRVYAELITPGYVTSWTPSGLRDVIPLMYQNPQVWDLCTKVFIYNNEKAGQPVTNIWEFTEPQWAGKLQVKDPFSEGVGMNFFTMVTRDDYASQLASAYKSHYGKDIKLTTKNAGYEWLKMLYKNGVVLGKSDTNISENIGAKGQSQQLVGLFTANKLRTADSKGLALAPSYNIEPFSGFYYPIYCFIPSNSNSPNAAKLFIQFNLEQEGWEMFNLGIGDYSPNPNNLNKFDPVSIEEWGKMLVFEDPQWCAEARSDVEEFISSLL